MSNNQAEESRHVYPGEKPRTDIQHEHDPKAREARIRYYRTLASAGLPLFPTRRDDGKRPRK